MVQLPGAFSTAEATTQSNFDPVPPGEYTMVISESELKTSKGGSQYLNLEHTIVEGQYEGRKLFNILNLYHHDSKVVKIAETNMFRLCVACGLCEIDDKSYSLVDTGLLHGIPFVAEVDVQAGTAEYPNPKNRIRKYKIEGDKASAPTKAAAPKPAVNGAATPPWAKK